MSQFTVSALVILRAVRVEIDMPEDALFDDIKRLLIRAALAAEVDLDVPYIESCTIRELKERPLESICFVSNLSF